MVGLRTFHERCKRLKKPHLLLLFQGILLTDQTKTTTQLITEVENEKVNFWKFLEGIKSHTVKKNHYLSKKATFANQPFPLHQGRREHHSDVPY